MSLSGELWPAHPKPLPDELLSSWIIRTARANGLKLQTFCERVFGKQYQLWNRDIDRSAPEWLLQSMARHTGTPIERVRQTTLRIYEGRLYPKFHPSGQLRWVLSAGMYHRKRYLFGIQFCPQCLAEDKEPYFRTYWRVAVLTFCPMHALALLDRCPTCGGPIAFHRRELGRPEVTEAGPLCICHACGFDLRESPGEHFTFYDASIRDVLQAVADYIFKQPSRMDASQLEVLHQLCKLMVTKRKSASLGEYVAPMIGAPHVWIPRGRQAFERREADCRRHVIQLSSWLLAEPETRLTNAWRTKVVAYSDLLRDFPNAPQWYRTIIEVLNRRFSTSGIAPPRWTRKRRQCILPPGSRTRESKQMANHPLMSNHSPCGCKSSL